MSLLGSAPFAFLKEMEGERKECRLSWQLSIPISIEQLSLYKVEFYDYHYDLTNVKQRWLLTLEELIHHS